MPGKRLSRTNIIRYAWILLAFIVFNLCVNWMMKKEGALDIGIQMNGIMLALYALGAWLALRKQWSDCKAETIVVVMAMLALALLMRLGMFAVQSGDYKAFLSEWIAAMQQHNGLEALSADIGDYNAPYQYILLLIAKLRPRHGLFYIKMISTAFDLLLAYSVRELADSIVKSRFARNAVFFAVLMIPTVALNGACWAQCDAIYTALALLGLGFGMQGKSKACFVFYALAFSFKLQTVFLLPTCIVLVMAKRIQWKDVWLFFVVYLAMLLPAVLAGKELSSLLGVYAQQLSEYKELYMRATSFFAWIPEVTYTVAEAQYLGIGLACMTCLALLYYCYVRREKLDNQAILECAFLFSLSIPFFLPYMHDRYFYSAEVLALLYFAMDAKRWPITVTVWLSGLFAYSICLFEIQEPILLQVMATLLFAALCYAAVSFVRRVETTPIQSMHAPVDGR